jgi:very-short-patch-repair endonuclease
MAASLASDGVVSHLSALALWDLRAQTSGPVHVTVRHGRTVAREGIRRHVSRQFELADLAVVEGIPCTSWARTLVDVAAGLQRNQLRGLVERAQRLRIFDARALNDTLERAARKRGTGKLRRLLAELNDEPPPTRSEFERRFLDLVRSASLPSPITNGLVHGHEVDFHWPEAKLIVETDGRETHATAIAFERDRGRDLDLKLAGWEVIRITWRQLRDEPERIAVLLRAKLGRV